MVISSIRSSEAILRTSSVSSVEFPNASNTSFAAIEQRRTRKRITPSQLEQLEELYRQSSHPTREQRDALGKRIQMETKSVTIWFQNKRQTDRKVALHKATHPRAIREKTQSTDEFNPKPPEASISVLKRTSSYASSVSSTSSTSSKSKRPSLDRVASRSEIRFIDKHISANDGIIRRAALGLQNISTSSSSHHTGPLISPISPVCASSALWSHMLSSPIAPSSPPPIELVAYSKTRKTRTLDWACTVARLSTKEDVLPKIPSHSTLGPAFAASKQEADVSEREYEDAMATTEDEAELVTPQASQTTSALWRHRANDYVTVTQEGNNSAADMIPVATYTQESGATDLAKSSPKKYPWQEDEMHAALALCGLRG